MQPDRLQQELVQQESLQYARPKLRPGHIFNRSLGRTDLGAATDPGLNRPALGSHVIFESIENGRQVVFPPEAAVILPLLDGQRTVPEILEDLFHTMGRAPFGMLFSVLERLQTQGCLDGADALLTPDIKSRAEMFEREPIWLTRPLFSVGLLQPKRIGEPAPLGFFVAALGVIFITLGFLVGAIRSGAWAVPNAFLKVDNSYAVGILFFFTAASVLTTITAVLKAVLTTLLTGVLAPIRLELNLFSIALRVDDDKLYVAGGKGLGTLAAIAVGAAQFFTFAAMSAIIPSSKYLDSLLWVSAILALIDMNPFRRSDLSRYFNAVHNDRSAIELLPYLKNRGLLAPLHKSAAIKDSSVYTAYSILAIVWTMLAYNLLLALLTRNDTLLLSSFYSAIRDGVWAEAIASFIIFSSLSLSFLYLIVDLAMTVYRNIVHPVRSEHLKRKSKKALKAAPAQDAEVVAQSLRKLPLFEGLQNDALYVLIGQSTLRTASPGAHIIVQDADSNELFVLLDGNVAIRRRQSTGAVREIARLAAPTVFGESTLLENTARSADVVALTKCRVLSIPRIALSQLEALSKSSSDFKNDFDQIMDRLTVGQYISSSELFKDAPKEAASLFLANGSIISSRVGRHVIEQGRTDKDFYLLLRGSVDVIRNGTVIKTLQQGDFFGEMAMILNAPRTATVMTREPCRFLRLASKDFWEVLTHNAGLAIYLETVTQIRLQETASL